MGLKRQGTGNMKKKLYIDLEICNKCQKCVVKCAYAYHPDNNGITYLREKGAFGTVCRHCEQAPCVSACPNDSLKKKDDGILVRANFKCTGCHSCVVACPFGTIFLDNIDHKTSQCDLCIELLKGTQGPACISTCPYGALKFGEFEANAEEHKTGVGEYAVVRALPWKMPVKKKKKG